MTNQAQQADLRTLIIETLTDTRLLALIQHWRKLSSRKQRALLRLARLLTT